MYLIVKMKSNLICCFSIVSNLLKNTFWKFYFKPRSILSLYYIFQFMGLLHLTRVALSYIGKCLCERSVQSIWIKSSKFGINVFESVLNGINYVRLLKGFLFILLCEAVERLSWCKFLKINGTEPYQSHFKILGHFKKAISGKNRLKADNILHEFNAKSSDMVHVQERL